MLNFYKVTSKTIEIDMNGTKVAYMSKTFVGWLIEVSDDGGETSFYWVEATAQAAFKECYHYLRTNKRDTEMYRRKWYTD